ncbi:septal ring lytic transglycosylase RlpA family protein [Zoogloea sp.]|uniref:septal ring lytic transglycosylase RlpA family protein n=1 Tax=Zoogloea sp. TaxID=49181 RepID=UPI00344FE7CF
MRPGSGGRYYLNDGPAEFDPAVLERLPDATPRREPLNKWTLRPYTVQGRTFTPATALRPFREEGTGSWYGRRYHGKPTSTGDLYDMFSMSAAHPTLPLPSYARVTNRTNGRSVVVRVNDRGPFVPGRIIDLSFAAAYRLGYADAGSAPLVVESLLPD